VIKVKRVGRRLLTVFAPSLLILLLGSESSEAYPPTLGVCSKEVIRAQKKIPLRISWLINKRAYDNGANCWAFVAYFWRVSDSLGLMSREEFAHWMEGPFVERVKSIKEVRSGDVLAIGRESNDSFHHYHAAIFLNRNTVVGKSGFYSNDPYQAVEISEVWNQYPETKGYTFRIFRPKDGGLVLEETLPLLTATFRETLAEIKAFENDSLFYTLPVEDLKGYKVLGKYMRPQDHYEAARDLGQRVEKLATTQLEKLPAESISYYLWKQIYHRGLSLQSYWNQWDSLRFL
jgi:hypothetical protein